jgi:2-polyprenyl-3-methyl-5-hydroxy-6-metoxy-1,4-benzoquinol methylase
MPLAPGCPICAEAAGRPFRGAGDRTLLICAGCRHMFWDRTPSAEHLAAYYATAYSDSHGQSDLQRAQRAYYVRHVDELAARSGVPVARLQLLDFGSSVPMLLAVARERGVGGVTGVDFDVAAHEFGRAHGVTMLTPLQLDSMPDASFDVVRCSHALEHVPDPRGTLRALVAKLRPGGTAYITQPSFPVFACGPSPADLLDMVYPEHLHFFSPISLMDMVVGAGLQITAFFTHEKASEVQARHDGMLDLDLARARLAPVKELGDPAFGPLNNFPLYLGENSVVWARRADAAAAAGRPARGRRRWPWGRV